MDVEVLYIPRDKNQEANKFAQHASKYKELEVEEHDYKWPDMAAQEIPTTNKD